jgi:hypothetical protein
MSILIAVVLLIRKRIIFPKKRLPFSALIAAYIPVPSGQTGTGRRSDERNPCFAVFFISFVFRGFQAIARHHIKETGKNNKMPIPIRLSSSNA